MSRSLYHACMVQLQMLLAKKEARPAAPELSPDAPNFMMMMRPKR